jgi:hypothetical protein
VYGATPGGISAAVAAARSGARVALIEPRSHIGGMMSNGLNWTDVGDGGVIGGVAAEFFDRTAAVEGSLGGRWGFHPSTADTVFAQMLSDARVTVLVGHRLAEPNSVDVTGGRILGFRTTTGLSVSGEVFVDASYEGDLMAAAGVSHRIGREGATEFDEDVAGARPGRSVLTVPAGLDPGFPLDEPGTVGSADHRIQASNFRVCLSTDPANRVPFPRPAGYDPSRYEIVLEYFAQRIEQGFTPDGSWSFHADYIGGSKWDLNECGSLSFGLPGANLDYPAGSWSRRAEIETYHRAYQKGLLYFLRNDPRVPTEIRSDLAPFGLCADEFTDNGNWPRMLYLREGRRLVGSYVLTQHDLEALVSKPDAIGLGSYRMDAHQVSRWISSDAKLLVEGFLGPAETRRWAIPYRSLIPRANEATNLLVPVGASATHVAYTSLRMEPQYMIMGQAAGTAAAMAAAGNITVQSVPIADLQARLRATGAVLDDPGDIAGSFYEAIAWAYHEGITAGCAPGRFCPTVALPRDQMAALLARALDLPSTTADFFIDDASNTHHDDINRVAAAGITFGCADQRYCPRSVVTREQMAGFLVRAFRLPPTDIDFFVDDEGSTLEVSINRLAASGITTGCTQTRFCPKASVTRGQTMAFLYRHYDGGPSGGWTGGEPTDREPDSQPDPLPSPTPTPSPTPAPTPSPSTTPSPMPSPFPTPIPVPTEPEPIGREDGGATAITLAVSSMRWRRRRCRTPRRRSSHRACRRA